MASVNQASLREEFTTLKGQFERLCAAGKVSEELRALVQALLMLLELLMAVFMEKHTPKSSRNSGLPPSQTAKDEETTSQPGTRAKGQGHTHTRAGNTRTIETVTIASVDHCAHCGTDLGDIPCRGHERRTLIDIVFETVLSHVEAEVKDCPRCHGQAKPRGRSHRRLPDRCNTARVSAPMCSTCWWRRCSRSSACSNRSRP